MSASLKILLPVAGLGARLRPTTWSRPKSLIEVAGQPLLAHVMRILDGLPPTMPREYVFITGYQGEQIRSWTQETFPDLTIHHVEQYERLGQSHALYQARQHLAGPMLMVFADTLIDTDLHFLASQPDEAVAWVREVPDPSRFGVAVTDAGGRVQRIVEKPSSTEHRLAVVGMYYFPDAAALRRAIETQLVQDIRQSDEFYLADAVNLLLEEGLPMRTERVRLWLDAGTRATTLETNAHLLESGLANFSSEAESDGTRIQPPVFIHPTAVVDESVIGPHVSIGAGCRIEGSSLENCIVETGAQIQGCALRDAMIGQRAVVQGVRGIIHVGDDSVVNGTGEV